MPKKTNKTTTTKDKKDKKIWQPYRQDHKTFENFFKRNFLVFIIRDLTFSLWEPRSGSGSWWNDTKNPFSEVERLRTKGKETWLSKSGLTDTLRYVESGRSWSNLWIVGGPTICPSFFWWNVHPFTSKFHYFTERDYIWCGGGVPSEGTDGGSRPVQRHEINMGT